LPLPLIADADSYAATLAGQRLKADTLSSLPLAIIFGFRYLPAGDTVFRFATLEKAFAAVPPALASLYNEEGT